MRQNFVDAINTRCRQMMEDMLHTSAIASVKKVTENRLADVTPELTVVTDDGREIPYPKISDAKVFMPGGAGGKIGIAYPVKPGDKCIALFGEGGTGSDLKWDLSNAILLPGFLDTIPNQVKKAGEDEAIILFAPNTTVTIKKDGVEIKQTDTTITVQGESIQMMRGGTSMSLQSSGISISAAKVSIDGNTQIKGEVSVIGNVSITGILTVGGINMNSHVHGIPTGLTGGPV